MFGKNKNTKKQFFEKYDSTCKIIENLAEKMGNLPKADMDIDSKFITDMLKKDLTQKFALLCQIDMLRIALSDGDLEAEEKDIISKLINISKIDFMDYAVKSNGFDFDVPWSDAKKLSTEQIEMFVPVIEDEYKGVSSLFYNLLAPYQLAKGGQRAITEAELENPIKLINTFFVAEIRDLLNNFLELKILFSKADGEYEDEEAAEIGRNLASDIIVPLICTFSIIGAIEIK